jgi:hypothetical protein
MRPRERDVKKKGVDPIWRGIGCVMLLVLTVGSYFASDAIITALNESNAKRTFLPGTLSTGIPRPSYTLFTYNFPRPIDRIGDIVLSEPIRSWTVKIDFVNLGVTVFFSIILYALVVLVWAVINPPKLGPKDAPPPDRKIDRSKVR